MPSPTIINYTNEVAIPVNHAPEDKGAKHYMDVLLDKLVDIRNKTDDIANIICFREPDECAFARCKSEDQKILDLTSRILVAHNTADAIIDTLNYIRSVL